MVIGRERERERERERDLIVCTLFVKSFHTSYRRECSGHLGLGRRSRE